LQGDGRPTKLLEDTEQGGVFSKAKGHRPSQTKGDGWPTKLREDTEQGGVFSKAKGYRPNQTKENTISMIELDFVLCLSLHLILVRPFRGVGCHYIFETLS
jgi:tRNA (Thr-GGU) A37 N-methylase